MGLRWVIYFEIARGIGAMEETGLVTAVFFGSASINEIVFFASQHGPELLFFKSCSAKFKLEAAPK